ncbi:hypothetical protein P171DRAFT_265174 [Karstenula rhodostoma CBS 690.94]|uniref:Uncharacterized protein n=1 Tax=Karstenula rhodostoma CBS 690.94 TaxID=1392251 RepID=A0A9P4UDH9_9PLEO|nr:hypothetical protein P171DRAFT_265174 [Karstenula rhodostoma CBS 690.94]
MVVRTIVQPAPNDVHPTRYSPIDDCHFLIPILLASASPYFNIPVPEHIIHK